MNNMLEQGLRELFAEDAASYDTSDAIVRLRAVTGQQTSRRRVLWPALGIASTGVVGLVVGLALALSSSTPVAYGFWSAAPRAATSAVIARASSTCAHGLTGSVIAVDDERAFSQRPLLAEVRGASAALVAVSNGKLYSCLMIGKPNNQGAPWHVSVARYGAVSPVPPANQITAPYTDLGSAGWGDLPSPTWRATGPTQKQIYNFLARHIGGGYGPYAVGQIGPRVTAVSFKFANQRTVSATVENGWYFAWWPWTSPATSVSVTTSTGTHNSPVTSPRSLRAFIRPGCQPGSSGCVFADTHLA